MSVFDVNDAAGREAFLRDEVLRALERVDEAHIARWGHMSAQQMVEHLIWAFELSMGQGQVACATPEGELPRARRFLYSNRETPKEFMNPALAGGLPRLRYATLAEAQSAFRQALERFLDGPRNDTQHYMHPLFGPLGYTEWHRMHYKHTHHHLLQFGLVEPPAPRPDRR